MAKHMFFSLISSMMRLSNVILMLELYCCCQSLPLKESLSREDMVASAEKVLWPETNLTTSPGEDYFLDKDYLEQQHDEEDVAAAAPPPTQASQAKAALSVQQKVIFFPKLRDISSVKSCEARE